MAAIQLRARSCAKRMRSRRSAFFAGSPRILRCCASTPEIRIGAFGSAIFVSRPRAGTERLFYTACAAMATDVGSHFSCWVSSGARSIEKAALVKQIEHATQIHVIDRMRRLSAHDGLGVVRNTHGAFAHEFQIVGTVSDADDLLACEPQ